MSSQQCIRPDPPNAVFASLTTLPQPQYCCLCWVYMYVGATLHRLDRFGYTKYFVYNIYGIYVSFFLFPLLLLASAPLAHILPPLRLATRPKRGHMGGGGRTPSCGTCLNMMFLSRVTLALSPSSTVKSMQQGVIYQRIQEESRPIFPGAKVRSRLDSPGLEPMT